MNEIQLKYPNELLVILDEECGFRQWFWLPEMSPEELEAWWRDLETVDPYYMTPEPLPGKVIQATLSSELDLWYELWHDDGTYTAHLFLDEDSYLTRPNRERVLHKGYIDLSKH